MNFVVFPEIELTSGYYVFYAVCFFSVAVVFLFWYVMDKRNKLNM